MLYSVRWYGPRQATSWQTQSVPGGDRKCGLARQSVEQCELLTAPTGEHGGVGQHRGQVLHRAGLQHPAGEGSHFPAGQGRCVETGHHLHLHLHHPPHTSRPACREYFYKLVSISSLEKSTELLSLLSSLIPHHCRSRLLLSMRGWR